MKIKRGRTRKDCFFYVIAVGDKFLADDPGKWWDRKLRLTTDPMKAQQFCNSQLVDIVLQETLEMINQELRRRGQWKCFPSVRKRGKHARLLLGEACVRKLEILYETTYTVRLVQS